MLCWCVPHLMPFIARVSLRICIEAMGHWRGPLLIRIDDCCPIHPRLTACCTRQLRHGALGSCASPWQHVCLQVLGVFAQLTSSTDEALARVLSAGMRGFLSVVVVSSNACRQRLSQRLEASQRPVPDFLCTSHAQPFRGSKGEVRGSMAPP